MQQLIAEVYRKCKENTTAEANSIPDVPSPTRSLSLNNYVQAIYEPFTIDDINQKIVEMLRPKGMQTPVELVFQSIGGLHRACPAHKGDWYFTGDYPTPGGIRLVNKAFVDYVEQVLKLQL